VREVGIEWRLRQLMADRGMFSTTDLMPLLKARGVTLSATQVYRLVTQTPERLNMRVLAAVCDALGCTPEELIEVKVTQRDTKIRAASAGSGARGPGGPGRPTRVRLTSAE